MLFGDRVKSEQLAVEIESEQVLASETVMDVIEEQADQLGVVLIEPQGGNPPSER